MGAPGRRRAVAHFSWTAIAERTMDVYRSAALPPDAAAT